MRHPHGLRAATGAELYIGTVLFLQPRTYNTYTWNVPAGTKYLFAKVWGSAGAPDGFSNGFPGGNGGSGGYAQAVIPVTPGETLLIGVGRTTNNGGATKNFGGAGGGFSSIFRGTTPLIIGGGGGGGMVNGTAAGGAGGGASGQASTDGQGGGTQSAGGSPNGSFLQGGLNGGGGGYYGGGGGSDITAGGGGSGFINASGNIYTSYTTGNRRFPPNTSDLDYPSGTSFGGLSYAVGGVGNNSDINTYGSGAVIVHLLGSLYNPAVAPVIPTPRLILDTF
jgi:hypothetical protein